MPECYLCPLTLDLMEDPVIAPDGHTYERVAIIRHIQLQNNSPLTREPLSENQLIPNRALRDAINEWREIFNGVYTIESLLFPGYHVDAFGSNGHHASLRLVKSNNAGTSPWGQFQVRRIENGSYTVESILFPGYYLDAYGSNGHHASLRLVKSNNAGTSLWGQFKVKTIV